MADKRKKLLLSSVIAEIKAAFASVSLDGGVTLHEARAIDDYESKEQQHASRANDQEQHWQELSDDKLCYFNDVLNFLDAKGWVFYIPAFMIWVLRHLEDQTDEHSGLNYMAIYSITFHSDRSKLLNDEQARAVCSFLRYLVSESEAWRKEAQEALDLCWGRYCSQ